MYGKSMYKVLEGLLIVENNLSPLKEKVFGDMWKSPDPSKVVVFFLKDVLGN